MHGYGLIRLIGNSWYGYLAVIVINSMALATYAAAIAFGLSRF